MKAPRKPHSIKSALEESSEWKNFRVYLVDGSVDILKNYDQSDQNRHLTGETESLVDDRVLVQESKDTERQQQTRLKTNSREEKHNQVWGKGQVPSRSTYFSRNDQETSVPIHGIKQQQFPRSNSPITLASPGKKRKNRFAQKLKKKINTKE
jgi:hypothetical protein